MHAIIAEGIRSVDGFDGKNTSSAHMVKIGTAHGSTVQPRLIAIVDGPMHV